MGVKSIKSIFKCGDNISKIFKCGKKVWDKDDVPNDFDGEKIYKCGDSLSKIYKCGEVVWSADTGPDYTAMPLTLQSTAEDGPWTVYWGMTAFQEDVEPIRYRINDGEWQVGKGRLGRLYSGDTIQFTSTGNSKWYGAGQTYGRIIFGPTQTGNPCCRVYGNIMSLVDKDNFANMTDLTQLSPAASGSNSFELLFMEQKIIDAENLVLPATTLTEECYKMMFYLCKKLFNAPKILPATTLTNSCYMGMFSRSFVERAPVLPAPILAEGCYEHMFSGTYQLKYIKCLATDLSATDCTNLWLYDRGSGVGTFVKKAGVEWPTGASGIPNNWTVIEE